VSVLSNPPNSVLLPEIVALPSVAALRVRVDLIQYRPYVGLSFTVVRMSDKSEPDIFVSSNPPVPLPVIVVSVNVPRPLCLTPHSVLSAIFEF